MVNEINYSRKTYHITDNGNDDKLYLNAFRQCSYMILCFEYKQLTYMNVMQHVDRSHTH